MKLPKIVWLIIFIVVGLPLTVWHVSTRLSYLDPQPYIAGTRHKKSNRLSIVVVGDNIAREAHDMGFDAILERRLGADVMSVGLQEATTRTLCYELAQDRLEWVLEGRPRYVVLLGGLYDHVGQYGPEFYAYHTRMIIDMLIYYGIRPVIVGIPHYDYNAQMQEYGAPHRLYNHFFSMVTSMQWDLDNFDLYKKELDVDNLPKEAIYIDASELGLEDSKCWDTPIMLSREGYANVANAIVQRLRK